MFEISTPIRWSLLLIAILFLPYTAHSDKNLSDDQKKEVVYRMYQEYKDKDFPDVVDFTPEEAKAMLRTQRVVFVDVRETDEMEVSTLPGAITKKEFLEDTNKYRGKTVVAYCTISYRSGLFAREMSSRDIPVFNLKGGILGWTLEGGRVFDAEGETRRINVYGDEWDYAPAGYESVTRSLIDRLF